MIVMVIVMVFIVKVLTSRNRMTWYCVHFCKLDSAMQPIYILPQERFQTSLRLVSPLYKTTYSSQTDHTIGKTIFHKATLLERE